jgi:hypothetical protein
VVNEVPMKKLEGKNEDFQERDITCICHACYSNYDHKFLYGQFYNKHI